MTMEIYMRDDEIEVLGKKWEPKPDVGKRNSFFNIRWIIGIVTIICILILCGYVGVSVKDYREKQFEVQKLEENIQQDIPLNICDSKLTYKYDKGELNDVPLHIYSMEYFTAKLTMDETAMDLPPSENMMVTVLATDIRKDNLLPVGDFVVNGKQISRGKSRHGYCAIIHGNISIGYSEDDAVMDYCIKNGGSFFRQYPLIINGEICKNNIKGKKIRRALIKQGDKIYIVESEHRESIHDFSEALQDLGVKNALNLPGGINYMRLRGKDISFENNKPDAGGNYLLFQPYTRK